MVKVGIVVASARFRNVAEEDWTLVGNLLSAYDPNKHYILTCNSDTPMGKLVVDVSAAKGFAVYEFTVQAHERGPKYLWEILYMSRHAALLELGEEFHIFVAKSRFNTIEDLVVRVKGTGKKLYLYDADGQAIS